MFGIIIFTVVLFWAVAITATHFARKAYKKRFVNTVIAKAQEEVNKDKEVLVHVEFKGYSLPMTLHEKKNIWEHLTTEGKKKALSDWKKFHKTK